MGNHISAEELARFASGRLAKAESRRIVRHLLTTCPACQSMAASFGRVLLDLDEGKEPPLIAADESAYETAIDRALATVLRRDLPRFEKECSLLDRLLAAAAEKPTLMEALRTVRRREHGGWPEVEAMLRLAEKERYRDRARMLELATLANVGAAALNPAVYGTGLVADLQARTMGELANAFRLNNEFECAEGFLSQAFARAQKGSGDDLVLARLFDITASLQMDRRQLGEALEMIDHAERIYHKTGESHLAGRALIMKGNATYYDDRPQEAVQLFRQGLAEIDEQQDSQLANAAQHNLIEALADCGEYREAGRRLLASNLREAFASNPINLLRLRWVEGRIFAGRRRFGQAERALLDTREGFLARGEEYDASLAGLDLAGVWLELGKTREVQELAEETFEIFRELEVHREAVRAVRYFRDACRKEEASVSLAREVLTFIRQVEWHPQRKFAI
jgi:tetratricopeptide (TPR) repeat protein